MTTPVITWIIEWMQCKPQDGDLTNVMVTCGWRCSAIQDLYSGTVYSSCSFPLPDEGGAFTPYADLTQDQVLGWCWANGVDKDATEAAVMQLIDAQINPPIISPKLPWTN